jgi:glutathione synthase/RimK-type ligase-like ATP-grasp enzyme
MDVLIVPAVENFALARKQLKNANYDTSYFKDLNFIFDENGPKILYKDRDCKNYDFVWLSSYWGTRDLAYGLQLYLDKNNVRHTKVAKSGSKVVDHMVFSQNDIPCPNTFFANTKKVGRFIDQLESTCKYPIVIKDIKGYRGKNTYLVEDQEQLKTIVGKLDRSVKVLFQEFIPNNYDWGVLVSNGKVVATEKSFPKKGEFRNNACNGAEEIFVEVDKCPANVRQIAKDAAKALDLEWCRSDIVVDKNTGEAKLLEVNRYPGITKGTDEVKAVVNFLNGQLK